MILLITSTSCHSYYLLYFGSNFNSCLIVGSNLIYYLISKFYFLFFRANLTPYFNDNQPVCVLGRKQYFNQPTWHLPHLGSLSMSRTGEKQFGLINPVYCPASTYAFHNDLDSVEITSAIEYASSLLKNRRDILVYKCDCNHL